MANDALALFRAWSKKFTTNKAALEPDATAKTLLAVIDHFNDLHFADRKRMRAEMEARLPKRPCDESYREQPR